MNLEFSRHIFPKNPPISNFIEFRPVGAELFRVDGWTDMTEANSRFSQFCERAYKFNIGTR